MRSFVVSRDGRGRPIGTVEAPDAIAAQHLAFAMWGARVFALDPRHCSIMERVTARLNDIQADREAGELQPQRCPMCRGERIARTGEIISGVPVYVACETCAGKGVL